MAFDGDRRVSRGRSGMKWSRSKSFILIAAGLFGVTVVILAVSFLRGQSIRTFYGNTPRARQAVELLLGRIMPSSAEVLFIAFQPGQDGGVFAAQVLLPDEATGKSIADPDSKLFSEGLSKPFENYCPEGIQNLLEPDGLVELRGWTSVNGYGCLVLAQDARARKMLIVIMGATQQHPLPRAV